MQKSSSYHIISHIFLDIFDNFHSFEKLRIILFIKKKTRINYINEIHKIFFEIWFSIEIS